MQTRQKFPHTSTTETARTSGHPDHAEKRSPERSLESPTQSPEKPDRRLGNEHAIYKPNARGTGGVLRFALKRPKSCLFLEAASQSGDKQFDWENKIIMKWGMSDLGSVLAVLQGRCATAKLFHQTEKAQSCFEISHREDPQRAPYMASVSRQNGPGQPARRVAIPISHAEAAVLEIALRTAVTRLLGW